MKKNIYILLAIVGLLFSCNENDSEEVVDNTVISEANDDEFSVSINESIELDIFANDVFVADAELVYIDEVSVENGEISLGDDGVYSYTPAVDYIGEDTFTYTLCEGDFPYENCDTATVTITVEEEVVVELVTTEYTLLETDYDLVVAELTDVEGYESQVENLNQYGNFNRNGGDTSWDDTQLQAALAIVLAENFPNATETDLYEVTYSTFNGGTVDEVMILQLVDGEFVYYVESTGDYSFVIPEELSAYYAALFSDESITLLSLLNDITEDSHTTILEYTDRHDYLYDADADLDNMDNVVLIYSGEIRADNEWTSGSNPNDVQTYNTEHVYPQSFLPGENQEDPSTRDLHNLRVVDSGTNSSRSNSEFVDGSGDYGYVGEGWYPGDEWKGDVARIVMYMKMYYNESFSDVADLDILLEWNVEDPVSEFELQRNDVIEDAQGNRNPFIDNPYLATLIWGGEAAENTWE